MADRLIRAIESRAALIVSILTLLALFVVPQISPLLADKTPPVTAFTKTEALNSPISPGDHLVVRIHRKKVRNDCPVSSQRWATNKDGAIFDVKDGEWRGGDAAANYIDFAYLLPPSMPAGEYNLHVRLTYTCPHVTPFEYDQPTTRFRIKD